MKINNFEGDLTDISAEKEPQVSMLSAGGQTWYPSQAQSVEWNTVRLAAGEVFFQI